MASHPATALTESFSYPLDDPNPQILIKWTALGPTNAQPLVFMHGTPWSSRLWAPFALALSSRYRVYIFDNPGYGNSKLLTADAEAEFAENGALTTQAKVTAALFDHWGFCNSWDEDSSKPLPHVVAHDNAGLVSLRVTLEFGGPYRSLTLVDVVAIGPWGLPFFKLVADNEHVFRELPPQMFEGIIRSYVRDAAYRPLSKEDEDMLAEPWISGGGRQGQDGLIRVFKQASKRISEDVEVEYHRLGKCEMPVLIIWGREDAWVPSQRASKLKDLIGGDNCEVVLVDEAGHLIQLDQPARLTAELATFLGDHNPARTN